MIAVLQGPKIVLTSTFTGRGRASVELNLAEQIGEELKEAGVEVDPAGVVVELEAVQSDGIQRGVTESPKSQSPQPPNTGVEGDKMRANSVPLQWHIAASAAPYCVALD